jgi:purine-binding chemotaxis protein CheW
MSSDERDQHNGNDLAAVEQPLDPRPSSLVPRRGFDVPELRVLVFEMDGQEYAADVRQVREIIRPMGLARLAGAPEYVAGLIKRRGHIVPVVDLRKRLGLTASAPSLYTCIVVAKLASGPVGLLVDSASDLMWVQTREFELPSPFVVPVERIYVQGMAHLDDRLLVLLDLERLFSPNEERWLGEMRDEASSTGGRAPAEGGHG